MPDGMTNQGDVKLAAEKPGTPQYTQEQVNKMVMDAKSAALADVGRFRVESEKALKAANAAQERLTKMQKDQEEAELFAARDEPEKLSAIQERQKRRQAESELAEARQELNEHKERLQLTEKERAESTKERNAREIAVRLTVDAEKLVKLSRFTDGTVEAIEEIARELPKQGKTLKPDSGGSIGGNVTFEQVREEYIKDPRNPAIKERYMEMRKARR
jgi:hypothetical protein